MQTRSVAFFYAMVAGFLDSVLTVKWLHKNLDIGWVLLVEIPGCFVMYAYGDAIAVTSVAGGAALSILLLLILD